MDYSADQRRAKIMELLGDGGEVKVAALSRLFGISEVTVRGDLESLEAQGLLSRIYGGAVSSGKLYYEMDLKQRFSANESEKKAVSEKVASMINDNDTILMNAGTTLTYVMRAIKNMKKRNISLVTNSIPTAIEASSCQGFGVTLLGGSIDAKYRFTYGGDALEQLGRYHADKLILSVDGISCEGGYTLFYPHETDISRMMMSRAASTVIAADYSKIGRIAFANIAPIDAADYIVTNRTAPKEYVESIRARGVNVITV